MRESRQRQKLEKLALKRDLESDENINVPNKLLKTNYVLADHEFDIRFTQNPLGHICDVCDRVWFKRDLSKAGPTCYNILRDEFPNEDVINFKLCGTCKQSIYQNKRIPHLSRSNGFAYPDFPADLPTLDCITERLISPRLPFMQIRRLRYEHGSKSIIGQVVNVPVDVNNMVSQLPRHLDDDYAFNVNIQRMLIHKSSYLKGHVKKTTVKQWLAYLLKTPLYRLYKIAVNDSFFDNNCVREKGAIEIITKQQDYDSELLLAQQKTLMWSEDKYLCIAPGENKIPNSIIYDEHAEELSFPGIYLGHPRIFKDGVKASPFSMATSEIRRRDRRGVTPEHILYMAMKIMRLRIAQGLTQTFKVTGDTAEITRKMAEDKEFIEQCVEHNLAFLKSIPNSVNYWSDKKKELFAMIRQLGKPTMFLTLSASEPRWPELLKILYKLKNGEELEGDPLETLNSLQRCTLVNEDPVTCVLYFNKLVDVIMYILRSKTCSPFGKYRVVDFFKRIEFQHRGSPHAHILLWLEHDPQESMDENMPETLRLIDELCSVDSNQLTYPKCQTHKHTFTCYKKNNKKCRFGAPFWPMLKTRILIPMPKEDGRKDTLKTKFVSLHKNLEENDYKSIDDFFSQNKVKDEDHYLNIIRAGISRPRVMLKRDVKQIWMNSFNPWIAPFLNSNMDIQFILEEFSCAVYVVEYVNKTNRGISGLQRELIKLREEHPDKDYTELLKDVSIKMLNSVEMSSQEAAWYLLRLGMSETSRDVIYIPTTWPHERQKVLKTRKQLDEEELNNESTDIWKEGLIQKYERRPRDTLAEVTLAQFVSKYYKTSRGHYELRHVPRVIRSRQYDMGDVIEYKREMVTLHYPFSNEEVDILDENKFLSIYDVNEDAILTRRKEFESGIDIAKTMEYCKQLCSETDETEEAQERQETYAKSMQVSDNFSQALSANNDDIKLVQMSSLSSIIRKRENVMSSDEYCEAMRMTNKEQRELILEAIHRMHVEDNTEPLQIFFTGPAGCGKTFTIKLLMETYNRFTQNHNSVYNSYIACASTGKAATAIDGTTVHSAFRISLSRSDHGLSIESLNSFRNGFKNIDIIFTDEVSMIGAELLEILNSRLQQINMEFDKPFGGFNIVFCGDLRQLPPVMATAIYKRRRMRFHNEVLWQTLKFYPLVQVVRQSDVTFSSILTKIGDGHKLTDDNRAILESRFVDADEINRLYPTAIRFI